MLCVAIRSPCWLARRSDTPWLVAVRSLGMLKSQSPQGGSKKRGAALRPQPEGRGLRAASAMTVSARREMRLREIPRAAFARAEVVSLCHHHHYHHAHHHGLETSTTGTRIPT